MKIRELLIPVVIIQLLVAFIPPVNAAAPGSERAGQVRYAKPGALGDCLSWATACDLGTAIVGSSYGDAVWAAAGTYYPTTSTDRSISFVMKIGVAVYGGFPASGGTRDSRDWESNPTILSGDIGVTGDTGDNSYHVVMGSSVNSAAILDGFTITAGYADGAAPDDSGAGLYTYLGNPTLANLAFIGNAADAKGGGMYSYESVPTLTTVSFEDNSAEYGGGLYNSKSDSTMEAVTFTSNTAQVHGGGIYAIASAPSLTHVDFEGNSAGEHGGGLLNTECNPTLTDVSFVSNTAERFGGAIANFDNSSPVVMTALFESNTALSGGAISFDGGASSMADITFSNNTASEYGGGICQEYSGLTVEDSAFINNSARHGGGIHSYKGTQTLTNVTFTGNSVTGKGGGMYSYESSLVMSEVDFVDNSAGILGGGMANYYLIEGELTKGRFSGNKAVDYGGAMYNDNSSPVLSFLSFSDNAARRGGGIYNYNGSPTITNSVFYHNTAIERGGGIYNYNSDPTGRNLTFSNNISHGVGGGLANYTESIMTLTNATFYKNTADVHGGGIYNTGGKAKALLKLTNAIVWGNSPEAVYGFGVDAAYCDIQGGYPGTGNIKAPPLLGPLQDNGGPTLTHALMPGNPAIDAGGFLLCPLTDQRGFRRPVDGDGSGTAECDMGAYEYGSYIYVPSFFIFLPLAVR